MAVAAPALIGAEKAVEVVKEALMGDFVVIRGKVYRERKEVVLGPDRTPTGRLRRRTVKIHEPVDLEIHLNPASLGIGAAALAAGAIGVGVAAWLLGVGVETSPTTEQRIRGTKEGLRTHENARHRATDPAEIAILDRRIRDAKDSLRVLRSGRFRITRRGRFAPDFSIL